MAAATVDLKGLHTIAKKNAEGLEAVTKTVDGLVKKLSTIPAHGQPHPSQVFGLPNVRTGENSMGSRGFSFMKMMGVLTGMVTPEEAKMEINEVHAPLHKALAQGLGKDGYTYGSRGKVGESVFLAPFATSFLTENLLPREHRQTIKSMVRAGMDGADHDEALWIRRNQLKSMGYGRKALSWLNELHGGAIVPPAEQGELIELLRNKEALINAGARTVPLPPQGRIKYPKHTAASTTFWVGENSPATESNIGTGEVTLQAKKLVVLIKAPNELIRFASPAAEALMRDDMTKSLALGLDLAGLEGSGGDNRPRGLTLMQNINRITSSLPGDNGDSLVGNDIYRMIAAVEESNAEFESFIMRPKTLYRYYQLRTDAVAQGDGQGPFLFNLIREASADFPATLAGHPVVKSTQVSQVRAKGTATNLSYIIGGMFSDLLIGMFGAIEFSATTLGDTPFINDQTWVKGVLSADIAARHEAAFVMMDNLQVNG